MASELDIYNFALGNIGITTQVGDIDEPSNQRRACSQYYEQARDEVLQDFPWRFAKRTAVLTVLDETTPGWGYTYQYPNACLHVRQVVTSGGVRASVSGWYSANTSVIPAIPFDIGLGEDLNQKVILTDLAEAYAIYTARVGITTVFPTDFVNLLAWKLAAKIALPLSVKPDIMTTAEQAYLRFLQSAGARAMNEARPDPAAVSPSIAVR